jgi:hypothetical protein
MGWGQSIQITRLIKQKGKCRIAGSTDSAVHLVCAASTWVWFEMFWFI